MAGCVEEEFINVLVLGTSNIKISQFVKLFSAYLQHDTFKEATFYDPNLKIEVENVTETRSIITKIRAYNFHFIDTPGLQKSYRSYKEISDILLYFKTSCHLSAIILLIEPDKKDSRNYFEQYTTHFLYGFKQFAQNILYVILNNDLCMFDQTYRNFQEAMDTIKINALVPQKSNVFHLHEETFFNFHRDNWEESVNFCRDVFEYITGNELKSFYVQCMIPHEKSFLSLICNLMGLLIEVYYQAEFYLMHKRLYYIYDYKKNVTVCYGKNCHTWKYMLNGKRFKVPKVCHECICTTSVLDIENCSIFHTKYKNCSVCGCNIASHHRNIHIKEYSQDFSNIEHEAPNVFVTLQLIQLYNTKEYRQHVSNIEQEKSIVISTLAQLYHFIKLHGYHSLASINDFKSKESESYLDSEAIFAKLNIEFQTELNLYSKIPLTQDKLLKCIYKLYEIKKVATIIPKMINDYFPEGFRLEVNAKFQELKAAESNEVKLLKSENENMKVENQFMKNELNDLKQRLDLMLNCFKNNLSSNNVKMQNIEKFNINQVNEDNEDL